MLMEGIVAGFAHVRRWSAQASARLAPGAASRAATRRKHSRRSALTSLGWALALCALPALLPTVASAESCPNAAYRSGPSAYLPDCRAYEQVTPVEKDGGLIVGGHLGTEVDGAATLTLGSFSSFAGIENNEGLGGELYSERRGESGWVTTPVLLPASQYETGIPAGFLAPILEIASVDNTTFPWFAQANYWPENRIDLVSRTTGGAIADIGPVTPPGTPTSHAVFQTLDGQGVQLVGVSDDMSHLLFRAAPSEFDGYHYWPFDNTTSQGGMSLYEYVGTGNTAPMLVGVDDAGSLISTCATTLGGENEYHNAISGDGATVFFDAHAGQSTCTGPPVDELFARIDNGLADARTVAISEPSAADCPLCDTSESVLQSAHFEGASQDGSKVFFTTNQPLLGGDSSRNIYEYDFEPPAGQPRVVRVSGGDATVTDPVASVEGVVRTSEDGSHVYFVAQGVLTRTANSHGQVAHTGANNLYVFERDAQYPTGRTEFIASLPEADSSLWAAEDKQRAADATPDGRFLVFVSAGDLTPDDTSSERQVFEYDAQTGALVRISIGQNGYNDNGNANLAPGGFTGIIEPSFNFFDDPRAYWSGLTVSADGAYVFFYSTLGLTPQASNNGVVLEKIGEEAGEYKPINNVYEYHNGNVSLISDPGDIGDYSNLLGTDASGNDVFFMTGNRLVAQDTDSNIDVYDARVDGGFPAPASPPECSGDGCQGPLSGAPVLLSPGSEFQAGGGNFAPPVVTSVAKRKAKKSKPKAKQPKKKARKAGKRRSRRKKGGRS